MNILLINTNPVVSRLVSLCMRDESISYSEVDSIAEIEKGKRYDLVLIDDSSFHEEVNTFLKTIQIHKMVFLSSRDSGEEIGERFDMVIKKPFLPSQIQKVIEAVKNDPSRTIEDDVSSVFSEMTEHDDMSEGETAHAIFPLASLEEAEEDLLEACESEREETVLSDDMPAKVLDEREIAQIKALLDDNEEAPVIDLDNEAEIEARKVEVITQKLEEDGLEIVREEEILDVLTPPKVKKTKKNKKYAKKKAKKKEEIYTFEEALLAAVENMKPKKIKKLLKGAEVTIKIRFKDDA